jgi:signal transduction histidine kinase
MEAFFFGIFESSQKNRISKIVDCFRCIRLFENSLKVRMSPKIRLLFATIIPPQKFANASVEQAFLHEFRAVGQQFAVYAMVLGCLLTTTAYILIAAKIVVLPINETTQYIRVAIVIFLTLSIFLIVKAPTFSIKHYMVVVSTPFAFAGISIGVMAFMNSLTHPEYAHRLLTALVISIWLSYSYARLPAQMAAAISFLASSPIYISAVILNVSDKYGVLMYIVVANIVGWVSCIQIERRERRVFLQSNELRELGETVRSQFQKILLSTQQKDRVLHGVVHDLRQPLASLDLYFSQFRNFSQGHKSESELTQLERMESCLNYIRAGVDRLLVDPVILEPECSVISLPDVLDKVTKIYEGPSLLKAVSIRRAYCRLGPIQVRSNESALATILSNLVENAIKFCALTSRSNRTVLIAVTRLTNEVRVDIIDNGVGIHDDEIGRIYELRYRGKITKSHSVEGSGLGLATVRNLCAQFANHKIEIVSNMGVGTRVRLRVPRI